jgi:CII-binding regulator of phage lambda lysogenization HflD
MMKTPNGDRRPADSGKVRNLNQLQPLLDPSHAAIEIVQTHGQTDVIAMQSGYLALEHRFTAREDRFSAMEHRISAMEERFAVQDERMSAMLAMIVRVAERLDGTPRPPSG